MQDGRGILLDFESNASLQTLADGYSDQIRYICGHVKDRLGLSALLIRPDGIIAWAADNTTDDNELQKAAARWFVRHPETRY